MNLPKVTVLRSVTSIQKEQKPPTPDVLDHLLSVESFMNQHQTSCKSGWKTAAWFGLQWAECSDYINIECSGCGDVLVQTTKHAKLEVIHSNDDTNSKRKISGDMK